MTHVNWESWAIKAFENVRKKPQDNFYEPLISHHRARAQNEKVFFINLLLFRIGFFLRKDNLISRGGEIKKAGEQNWRLKRFFLCVWFLEIQ